MYIHNWVCVWPAWYELCHNAQTLWYFYELWYFGIATYVCVCVSEHIIFVNNSWFSYCAGTPLLPGCVVLCMACCNPSCIFTLHFDVHLYVRVITSFLYSPLPPSVPPSSSLHSFLLHLYLCPYFYLLPPFPFTPQRITLTWSQSNPLVLHPSSLILKVQLRGSSVWTCLRLLPLAPLNCVLMPVDPLFTDLCYRSL